MGINVLEKGNEHVPLETLGAVIRRAYFIHTSIITLTSTTLLLVMSCGNYWPSICQQPDAALFGLIGAVYTLSITGLAVLVSTILIDDCSWFFKFFTLLSSSCLYIGCGLYHLYGYFRAKSCFAFHEGMYSMPNVTGVVPDRKSATNNSLLLSLYYRKDFQTLYNCYDEVSVHEYSAYTPLLIFSCIFAGVVYFLFAVYLVLTFDTE